MLLSFVGLFVAGRRLLHMFSTEFTGVSISKVQVGLGAGHVALAVVHPAEGEGKDENDDDDGSDQTTHVLLDFSAGGVVLTAGSGGTHDELSGGLGLADSTDEAGVDVGLVDPAALVVVGSLEALVLGGGVAEGADAEVA